MNQKKKRILLAVCIALAVVAVIFTASFWADKSNSNESSMPESPSSFSAITPEPVLSEPGPTEAPFALFLDIPETVKKQSEVVIPVVIQNNPGMLGARIQIVYDETALELLDAEEGDTFKGVLTMTPPAAFYSGCSFVWDGVDLRDQDIRDGEILRLKFRLLKPGKYSLSVQYEPGDIVDSKMEELLPAAESQFVLIE